jgi:hypothetical protein
MSKPQRFLRSARKSRDHVCYHASLQAEWQISKIAQQGETQSNEYMVSGAAAIPISPQDANVRITPACVLRLPRSNGR